MTSIDWDGIYALTKRDLSTKRAKLPTFSDADKAAAIAAVNAMPGDPKDSNIIPTLWNGISGSMPTIRDLDFVGVTNGPVDITTVFASNKALKRDGLIWHIQNVPAAKNPSIFTKSPLVGICKDGNVIIDGHHRVGALKILGVTSAACNRVPMNCKIT